jgi:hypothetical protein
MEPGAALESFPIGGLADFLETTPTRLRWILNERPSEELAERESTVDAFGPLDGFSRITAEGRRFARGLEGIPS